MMDWTDRHCRYFHRLLTRRARLYTEMVTTGALLHGDVPRHLDFDPAEQPVALQLGGSEPAELAAAARLGERWGYAEINLNCGCPSERVQRGSFGACLMAEPQLVAECVEGDARRGGAAGDGEAPDRHRPARELRLRARLRRHRRRSRRLRGLHRPCPQRLAAGHQPEGEPRAAAAALRDRRATEARLPGADPRRQRRHQERSADRRAARGGRRRDDRPRGLSPSLDDGLLGRRASSPTRRARSTAMPSRRRWSTTWSGSSAITASRGRGSPGT